MQILLKERTMDEDRVQRLEYVSPPTAPWTLPLECCICLSLALLPVRPRHHADHGGDCSLVLCLGCYRVRVGVSPCPDRDTPTRWLAG